MEEIDTDNDSDQSLEEILEPLIELLAQKYDESEYQEPCMTIDITGGQMYRVDSPYPRAVLIEMPGGLYECTPLASAVATLLKRSGSDYLWFDHTDGEEDPCRAPLRFSIVKKTICMPSDYGFSQGDHLMVDAIEFDAVAAARQVAMLVEYLKDPANLVVLTDAEAWMF